MRKDKAKEMHFQNIMFTTRLLNKVRIYGQNFGNERVLNSKERDRALLPNYISGI